MFRRVYLDNSATTPVDPRVLDAMMPFLTDKFGNASSIHFYGQETRAAVDKARHQVAGLLNPRPAEIVFTSGGTESNNLAIKGLIESIIALRSDVSVPPHIITTQIEHPAVKMACEDLENEGVSVTFLPVAENGVIRIADVENAITDSTVLISIMTANNEIGTLQPVSEIGRFVRDQRRAGRKIYFHTDAVQAVGKVPIDVEEIGCDLLSLSAHKFHAPKGVGALYVRRGTRLHAQNIGGRQERGLRGGTEPVPLIAGMGAAAEIAGTELAGENERLAALRNRFEDNILERIDGSRLNGDRSLRLPNISNISFEGIEGEALLINLDMQGIAVSTGSACSSGSLEPSPVIRALGADDQRARSAIRFSLGRMNTEEDIDAALNTLPRSIEDLRAISRPR